MLADLYLIRHTDKDIPSSVPGEGDGVLPVHQVHGVGGHLEHPRKHLQEIYNICS